MRQRTKFFDALGVVTGDGGDWLREQTLILAQNNHTDASFWLSLPLRDWDGWIRANNAVVERQKPGK